MKFRDGYWGIQPGISCFNAVDIRDIEINKKSLTVFAASRKVNHRGDTLNTPMVTLEYSSPVKNVIKVSIIHFKGKNKKNPKAVIYEDDSNNIQINHNSETNNYLLKSENLTLTIPAMGSFESSFRYNDVFMTSQNPNGTGFAQTENGETYMRQELALSPEEVTYGLGERFTPFTLNGQAIDMWNDDGGTATNQIYKSIPFYLSSRGYGVFVNDAKKVSFEMASELVSATQFSVEGEELEYYIIAGDTLKDVISNYTLLTGRPPLPPAWSFGLWLTTSFTESYDEKTVSEFINGMIERKLPLSVFHYDCFWMKEYQWCDFSWDASVFPDPVKMLGRLYKKGLKVCVWINPYIAQKSQLFDEAMNKGYLLKDPHGGICQTDKWQPGMAYVDFTNPDASDWYASKLKTLLDMGVDCFKTDFGEEIPVEAVYYDGSNPDAMHNYYSFLYNKTVFELLIKERGKEEAIVFARSGWAGSQQFPVHWGGDSTAQYTSMAESLRGGLSLGMTGFAFWSHDIGGFDNTATPDLYKRWLAFGFFSSHSRLHGNSSYRVPWIFDEESVDVLRFFANTKNKLMPYIYTQAQYASLTGIPIMRAMILEFPNDPTCRYLDRQYMFGDSILTAPVLNPAIDGLAEVEYYLPEGSWTHLFSGKKHTGPAWYCEKYNYFSLPVFVRENSIIAMGNDESRPDYDWSKELSFNLYEISHNASCTVISSSGDNEYTINAERDDNKIHISSNRSIANFSITIKNTKLSSSSVGKMEYNNDDTVIQIRDSIDRVTLVF